MPADTSAMHEAMASQPSELARILADTARGGRRHPHPRGQADPARGHRYELPRREPRCVPAARGRARGVGDRAVRRDVGRPGAGAGDAPDRALAPQQQALHDDRARRGAAAARSARSVISGSAPAATSRPCSRAQLGLHGEPPWRLRASGSSRRALGAELDGLEDVPDAVAQRSPTSPLPRAPPRLLEFTGAGTTRGRPPRER